MWHILGDGEQRPLVQALAARHANLEWHGYVDPAAMPGFYRAAGLLVSTSQWEGYPYFLLEARAFDLPVVAFDIPGVSDILADYQRGRLVGDLSGMREAVQSYADWATAAPQASSDQFEPDHIYRQLLDALGGQS
jgi:glycosyltransferase involved in cell wall biosynthesis